MGESWASSTTPHEQGIGISDLVVPLEQLNAEAAERIYLPLKEAEIRLVKLHRGDRDDMIRCSVFSIQQYKGPSFKALSYV